MVIVKFIGGFKALTRLDSLELSDSEVNDVAAVLMKLVERFGSEFEDAIFDKELKNPRGRALILKNGREIGVLEGLRTRVESGDTLVIIPVVHGG
ncbi:MAG: MoaD/ThiS family protein [Candidatus Bathyarchaeia archaeon]